MTSHDFLVPISAIEHHEYCPRQCALIHLDGVWADNIHTIRGTRQHRRSDDAAQSREEHGKTVLRALPLHSELHGLTGRADTIEIHPDGSVLPVEHKAGVRHGITADLQVCAQALCLEEMLQQPITRAAIWYGGPRRRHAVALTEQLRYATLRAVAEIRANLASGPLPAAPNDARCPQCQLRHHCLPEITSAAHKVQAYIDSLL